MKAAPAGAGWRAAACAFALLSIVGLGAMAQATTVPAAGAGPATKTSPNIEPAILSYHAISAMLERLEIPPSPQTLRIVIEVAVFRPDPGQSRGDSLFEDEKKEAIAVLAPKLAAGSALTLSGIDRRDFPIQIASATQAATAGPLHEASASPLAASTTQPATQPATQPTDQALLGADDVAIRKMADRDWLLIIVRIVDYRSGRFDLFETTARLLDRQTGKELARDVSWTSMVDGVTRARFIDGSRAK